MKTLTVPTAPSERAKRQSAGTAHATRLAWLVSCIGLSLVAGGVGALMIVNNYPVTLPSFESVSNDELVSTAAIAKNITEHHAEAIVKVYQAEDMIGQGVIVSSDGWCVMVAPTLPDTSQLSIAFASGDKKIVTETKFDQASNLLYLKVTGQSLTMINFAQTAPYLGDVVLVYGVGAQLAVGYVGKLDDNYQLDRSIVETLFGAPVFDRKGNVIGLLADAQTIIPIQVVSVALEELFRNSNAATLN